MEKELKIIQEYCIHCGICAAMDFAEVRDWKMYIKENLPMEKRFEAEHICPVAAIQQVAKENENTDELS